MRQLIEGIRRQLAAGPITSESIKALQALTREAMPNLQSSPLCSLVDEPGRYLCYKDGEFGFVVMMMVWGPGDETPIHDHGTWGVEAILMNRLMVTAYTECEIDPKAVGSAVLEAGQIMSNMPPDRDVHRVSNPSDDFTISLHIYGQEMSSNRQFVPGEGYKPCHLKTNALNLPAEFRLDQLHVS